MSGELQLIEIASAIMLGFFCLGFTIWAILTNLLVKLIIKRLTNPGKNYGLFGIKEPGKQINFRIQSFKETEFVDGERVFVVPEELRIYRAFGAPFVIFDASCASAIKLEKRPELKAIVGTDGQISFEALNLPKSNDDDIWNPSKLFSWFKIRAYKAEAGARRKVKLDAGMVMLLLEILVLVSLISVYLLWTANGKIDKLVPAAVQSADSLGKLIPGGK